jgi:carbon-monoxide dehydrogenase large subunit
MTAPLLSGARFIGQRLPRKEDLRLLTGRGTFVDDVAVPGMLHAAFLRSPIARGRILSIDTTAARALPGVRAVYTSDDFAPLGIELMSGYPVEQMQRTKIPPMAEGQVHYVGDPVAIVVAESRAIAEDAAGLIQVDYAEEQPVVTLADARTGAPVFPGAENNVAAVMALPEDPDIAKAFASARHVVETTIRHQRVAHAPMEPRGVVVVPQGAGELTVHIGCQSPKSTARTLAATFGMGERRIRVFSKDVGGAFGLKSRPWREEVATIAAGLLLDRPVKWFEDRLENMTSANQAREQECTLRAAFDADGKLLASNIEYALNNGAYPHFADANAAGMMFVWGAYKQPRFHFHATGFHTNTIGLAAYRGPWAVESLARETLIDVAARQMGMDPIQLRRKNLVTAADQPHTTNIGMVLTDVTPAECLEQLLTVVDVPAFRKEQAEARAAGRYLGLGIASYIEPTAAGSFAPMATEVAEVRIEPDGRVTALLGTHSQGQGTETTMAQIIADRLGVRFEDISVFEDDSASGGYGAGAGGSRQGVIGGGATVGAAERLRDKVKQLAAHLLNASEEAVRVEDGMVHVEGAPEMTRSLGEIAAVAYGEPHRLPEGMDPGLYAQFRYSPPPITFASASHACVVEVDVGTGFVKILRWVCSEDCGVVINPGVVEGQIAGGLAQAIGMVLLEEMHIDERGTPTSVTFKDYLMPAISDVPDFEYTHIVTPSASKGGFRGVGEGGAIIGPPTLINAIHDALAPFGVTCLDLPLSPSKLLAAIEAAEHGSSVGLA